MKKPLIDFIKRGDYDELYTPEYAIKPLLKYLPENIKVWECTDYEVISTKKEYFDFLKDIADFDFDMIITNPPYSLKDEFIKRCYDYGKPFCLLLPITSLEGIKRGKMFRQKGIEVLVFDKRIDFNGKGQNWYNTSWFCWGVLPKPLLFEELKGSDK